MPSSDRLHKLLNFKFSRELEELEALISNHGAVSNRVIRVVFSEKIRTYVHTLTNLSIRVNVSFE